MEVMRRNDDSNVEADVSRLSTDISQLPKDQGEEDIPFPEDFEEEVPVPMEEEVLFPLEEGEDLVLHTQEEEMNIGQPESPTRSPTRTDDSSVFSLGAVNDLEEDLQEQPRQEKGDELISSTSKWHKHTVKVLTMLQNNMASGQGNVKEGQQKSTQLSFDNLSYGVSRRTACGVFFELLQLKTWDYIDLDQDESYADIKITPAVRFDEAPATD